MTRFKSLLAAVAGAAMMAVVPASSAQSAHFVGAGSSAQWQMAAIAADQLALNENGGTVTGTQGTICHWTFNNGGTVSDSRDSLNRITPELGNVWLVWISDSTCAAGNVTTSALGIPDVWIDLSVDSTVGVRVFSAQENVGGVQTSGGQILINQAATTAGQGKINSNLWPDNQADAALSATALAAVNTAVSGGLHVNVGITDIRAEDALAATTRAIAALNTTTYKGLGYVGPTANIGAPINTDQGTGTNATPIKFALQGKGDPFKTSFIVPAYTSIPIGAAPIVFISNNGGTTPIVTNLVTGISPGFHAAGQTYPASALFGGTVACDTHAKAFGGNDDGAGTALTLFLREPLSGTMNTTEFSLFRSFGNTNASQEVGVINPTRSPYNPLHLGCPTHGLRSRAIGTGEVVGKAGSDGLLNTPNSVGYIFFGFGNAAKLTGAGFNYLTVDGVDPLAIPGTVQQELPNCTTATCSATVFWPASGGNPAGFSYPHLRDGTYKAWSIYRWLIASSNIGSDPFGFDAVAQGAQDFVDQDVADFVPFHTTTGSDGLEVYRSHFTQSGITCSTTVNPTCNGNATSANTLDGGNTLGGGPELGGDEGGLIEGPFGETTPEANGYVTWASTITTGKGYKVSWKQGAKFVPAWGEGWTITLNGTAQTVATCGTCKPTATTLYVTSPNPLVEPVTAELSYSAPFSTTHATLAASPGVLGKKQ